MTGQARRHATTTPRSRRGMGAAARMGLLLVAAMALLGATVAVVAVTTFDRLAADLPDPVLLGRIELAEKSVVTDRTGTVELARFGEFNREVVPFAEIPAVLLDATTAVEDATFWENAGFDPVGIVAAGVDALRGRPRGASTITQQLVRQRLLTEDGVAQTQVSANRKLKEIIQSIRVTQAFPGIAGKERIIAAYLNQNYYGNESYGIAAAAKGYFGVGLGDLTLAQAAILAALPQAPSTYDLVANAVEECVEPDPAGGACLRSRLVVPSTSRIVQRRNLVLDLMARGRTPLSGDVITAADYAAAKAEPVVLAPQVAPRWTAPHFVWQVRRELAARLCGEGAETCPVLERGGLAIRTTLDVRLQGIAERWVKVAAVVPHQDDPKAAAEALGIGYARWIANLTRKDLHNGALVALDYETGELVAYVGSGDPYARTGTDQFQPRFDVLADGWRQPGSAFKPIVYATGIEGHYITAGSMFMDVVTDFGGGYTPVNADRLERGPVRVRDALRFSLNVPAVKALAVTGVERVEARAEALGIRFAEERTDAGLSFALGVEEVHPVDLVRAYGALANGGRLAERTTLIEVVASDGTVLVEPRARAAPVPVISAETAWILTDILEGNTDRAENPFWGRFAIRDGDRRRPATLKTGTNNDARDLNAYGYLAAPDADGRRAGEYALAVGVWNGNSDNSLVSTPAAPLFSLDASTHVWKGFLDEASAGWAIRDFARPGGVTSVAIDPFTGLAAAPGAEPIVEEWFVAGTAPSSSPAGLCGEALLLGWGFEKDRPVWLEAARAWLVRAEEGTGVRGGPEETATAHFYNAAFTPYGATWGALLGEGPGCASPSPTATPDPCASPDPSASPPPSPSPDPLATPVVCPTPEPTPSAPPPNGSPEPTPSAPPPNGSPEPTPAP